MRVAIAGAGAVGRSIAKELVAGGHEVMLIERDARQFDPPEVEQAEWVLADACELSSLEDAGMETCDVVIAATGDDKVNLVVSLLAKTEFAVKRVVARVNDPDNEWLFTPAWGVDVAVSTPRMLATSMRTPRAMTGGMVVASHLRTPKLPPQSASLKPLYQWLSSPTVTWARPSICVPTLSLMNTAQLCQAILLGFSFGSAAGLKSPWRRTPSGPRNVMIAAGLCPGQRSDSLS